MVKKSGLTAPSTRVGCSLNCGIGSGASGTGRGRTAEDPGEPAGGITLTPADALTTDGAAEGGGGGGAAWAVLAGCGPTVGEVSDPIDRMSLAIRAVDA